MVKFEGFGKKNNIEYSRDSIIKKGWIKGANIGKVNKILVKSFNTNPLTPQEALEYIIKDSLKNMTINSPKPQLSDFGLTQSVIDYDLYESVMKIYEDRYRVIERQSLNYWNGILNNKQLNNQQKGDIFEKEMANLFRQLGWNVEKTQLSKDGGVDIIIVLNGDKCLVQCKFWKAHVGAVQVKELWANKDYYKADRVMMIAFEGVTRDAENFVQEMNKKSKKGDWLYKIWNKKDIVKMYSKIATRN